MARILVAALLLAGCMTAAEDHPLGAAPDRGGADGTAEQCVSNDDCVAVGATCCDCPSYAVPAHEGYEGCDDLGCEPSSCPAVEAACTNGTCELRCQAVITEQTCRYGFARDTFGCLVDRCAAGSPPDGSFPGCLEDTDCRQVAADCCGCEKGGSDTAVPEAEVDTHEEALACPPEPTCPGVNTCEPDAVPRCLGGTCMLVAETPDEGATACGSEETGLCAPGQVCVLNHPDAHDASALGLGVCRPE